MNQLAFDLAEQGANAAAARADRVHANWSAMALQAFLAYAKSHKFFTTEDVRAASAEIPSAPDSRAWGAIALAAKNQGICAKRDAATVSSRLKHAHSRPLHVWQSLVFQSEGAEA